jgi:hypothetical protein
MSQVGKHRHQLINTKGENLETLVFMRIPNWRVIIRRNHRPSGKDH